MSITADERSKLHRSSSISLVAARTGIPAMTLRAWEKRFGYPAPLRRPGSDRRVYAPADIDRLTLLRRVLERGFRIGDVVHKSLEELDELARPDSAAETSSESSPEVVARALALLEQDRLFVFEESVRRAAMASGPKRFITEFAHPLAIAVGEAWAAGKISVRHEHIASECLTTFTRQCLAQLQSSEAGPTVVLGCLPGEPHTLAAQFVAVYVAAWGAKPVLLGARTPIEELIAAARSTRARAVGLSVSRAGDAVRAKRAIAKLRRALSGSVALWVGGGGARALSVREDRATTVTSWDELENALAALGRRARGPRRVAARKRSR